MSKWEENTCVVYCSNVQRWVEILSVCVCYGPARYSFFCTLTLYQLLRKILRAWAQQLATLSNEGSEKAQTRHVHRYSWGHRQAYSRSEQLRWGHSELEITQALLQEVTATYTCYFSSRIGHNISLVYLCSAWFYVLWYNKPTRTTRRPDTTTIRAPQMETSEVTHVPLQYSEQLKLLAFFDFVSIVWQPVYIQYLLKESSVVHAWSAIFSSRPAMQMRINVSCLQCMHVNIQTVL